jgi:hypothetical protein
MNLPQVWNLREGGADETTMEIDWSLVKKLTLWSYEDLLGKLLNVLAYTFVQEHYNHTMQQALVYNGKIREGYLQNRGEATVFIDAIADSLTKLEKLGLGTYSDLVHQVVTRDQCMTFLQKTGFDFEALIQVLNYLLRWVLPFKTPLREFIDADSDVEVKCLEALKKLEIRSNLDLLEIGRTNAGRVRLSGASGIPLAFVTGLVHRADISRLAYVRGKTVKYLCGGGYDSAQKIATANLAEMEAKMDAYYRTLGKSLADFKSVVPLAWMIGGAKTLPRVMRS